MARRNGASVRPKLHHFNLKTTRLQEMVEWYGKVVGTEVVHQYPGGAWLTNDEANHRIALLHSPRLKDDPANRLRRFESRTFSVRSARFHVLPPREPAYPGRRLRRRFD